MAPTEAPFSLGHMANARDSNLSESKRTGTAGGSGAVHEAHSSVGSLTVPLEKLPSRPTKSDGLSGGAVFHLAEDARGFYCGFAGIVLRGGDSTNIIHFMDPRLIKQFFLFNPGTR